MSKHTPKEFWILDTPSNPYPTCYRGEPRWDGEPDTTGVVIRVQEITPLTEAAPELLALVKRFQLYFETYSMQDMDPDQLRGELEPDVFERVMKDRKEIEDIIVKAEGA